GEVLREARANLPADDPFTGQVLVLAEGEYGLARGDYAGVVSAMEEFIPVLRQRGIRLFICDALSYQGRALYAQGQAADAYHLLREAQAEARALGARQPLWPILIALSEIEAQRGHTAAAATLRREARTIIDYIAAHAGTPD